MRHFIYIATVLAALGCTGEKPLESRVDGARRVDLTNIENPLIAGSDKKQDELSTEITQIDSEVAQETATIVSTRSGKVTAMNSASGGMVAAIYLDGRSRLSFLRESEGVAKEKIEAHLFDGPINAIENTSVGYFIGGSFTFVGDYEVGGLILIRKDGSINEEFYRNFGGGCDGVIRDIVELNQELILGGNFFSCAVVSTPFIARVGMDGVVKPLLTRQKPAVAPKVPNNPTPITIPVAVEEPTAQEPAAQEPIQESEDIAEAVSENTESLADETKTEEIAVASAPAEAPPNLPSPTIPSAELSSAELSSVDLASAPQVELPPPAPTAELVSIAEPTSAPVAQVQGLQPPSVELPVVAAAVVPEIQPEEQLAVQPEEQLALQPEEQLAVQPEVPPAVQATPTPREDASTAALDIVSASLTSDSPIISAEAVASAPDVVVPINDAPAVPLVEASSSSDPPAVEPEVELTSYQTATELAQVTTEEISPPEKTATPVDVASFPAPTPTPTPAPAVDDGFAPSDADVASGENLTTSQESAVMSADTTSQAVDDTLESIADEISQAEAAPDESLVVDAPVPDAPVPDAPQVEVELESASETTMAPVTTTTLVTAVEQEANEIVQEQELDENDVADAAVEPLPGKPAKKIKQAHDKLKTKLKNLVNTRSSLKKQIKKYKDAYRSLAHESNSVRAELKSTTDKKKKAKLEKKVQHLRKLLLSNATKLSSFRKRLNEVQGRINDVKAEIKKLRNSLVGGSNVAH